MREADKGSKRERERVRVRKRENEREREREREREKLGTKTIFRKDSTIIKN